MAGDLDDMSRANIAKPYLYNYFDLMMRGPDRMLQYVFIIPEGSDTSKNRVRDFEIN